jgi:cephalosporin hydroxylase
MTDQYYMEDNLEMRLKHVLRIMQQGIIGEQAHYCGVRTLKSPMDAWVYQEIIWELKPDTIIEIGNKWGGSALMLMDHLERVAEEAVIIAVDKNHSIIHEKVRNRMGFHWIEGLAADPKTIAKVKYELEYTGAKKVMIIEDSEHSYDNTLAVLKGYSQFVTPGQYFIIEDSIMNHGLARKPWQEPYKAIEDFIKETDRFEIDRTREKFFITWNPKGYLKCII